MAAAAHAGAERCPAQTAARRLQGVTQMGQPATRNGEVIFAVSLLTVILAAFDVSNG